MTGFSLPCSVGSFFSPHTLVIEIIKLVAEMEVGVMLGGQKERKVILNERNMLDSSLFNLPSFAPALIAVFSFSHRTFALLCSLPVHSILIVHSWTRLSFIFLVCLSCILPVTLHLLLPSSSLSAL